MPGRITAFIFEKSTAAYLAERIDEDDVRGQVVDNNGYMPIDPITVDDLAEGDHVILILANLEKHSTARFTLKGAENHDVSMQVHFDLMPLIESAVTHHDAYTNAAQNHGDDRVCGVMDEVDADRMSTLSGLMPPYTSNEELAAELLTAIDLLTYDVVQEVVQAQEHKGLLEEWEPERQTTSAPDQPRYLH